MNPSSVDRWPRPLRSFPRVLLDQAYQPNLACPLDDDSNVSSIAYPYSTLLAGIPDWVSSYRLSPPHTRIDGQSLPWGECITPASGGQEFHLHRVPSYQRPIGLSPQSLALKGHFWGTDHTTPLGCAPPFRRLLQTFNHDVVAGKGGSDRTEGSETAEGSEPHLRISAKPVWLIMTAREVKSHSEVPKLTPFSRALRGFYGNDSKSGPGAFGS